MGINHRAPAAVTECYMLGNIRSGGWCPTERGSMNDLFTNKSKEEIAIERLQAFCPPDGYYVAFSGGKDSVVILDLVKRAGVPFDAHYNFTTVDPPELVKFIKTFSEVEIRKPQRTMFQLIVDNAIMPTHIMRFCCRELKETGGEGRFVVTGIRWAESYGRSKRKMVEACFKDDRRFYVRPIIDWSTEDVWNYIRTNKLRYCSLYNEGWKRIGCVMCPMAGTQQMLRDEARWPKIAKAYKKSATKAVAERIKKGLPMEEALKTGESLYHWWVFRSGKKQDPDQTVMFE
jgi:phosphoadenosine phosphosulfate reductase